MTAEVVKFPDQLKHDPAHTLADRMSDLADGESVATVLRAVVCLAGFIAEECLDDEDKPLFLMELATAVGAKTTIIPSSSEGVN